ncbi:hypothetical protein G6M78_04605 [Agrobacterium tumefaciens]|uniref:hypothetical protein n=1 Tax=Agrobacterium tumefaciens TaxID=358 RepID=UPI001573708E|nr:hypothetical protein [Agrobacterium tumefaciens]NTE54354.1 hypothetical protein [Agrobacterium tumefaciens]NTE70519.1 hypothetical protein [Agrobacterium tumefaciens]
MGAWRPKSVSPYSSKALDKFKRVLEAAIIEELDNDPSAADKIKACIKSARSAHIRDLKDGLAMQYGPVRLGQMAEALGYDVDIVLRRASR